MVAGDQIVRPHRNASYEQAVQETWRGEGRDMPALGKKEVFLVTSAPRIRVKNGPYLEVHPNAAAKTLTAAWNTTFKVQLVACGSDSA